MKDNAASLIEMKGHRGGGRLEDKLKEVSHWGVGTQCRLHNGTARVGKLLELMREEAGSWI